VLPTTVQMLPSDISACTPRAVVATICGVMMVKAALKGMGGSVTRPLTAPLVRSMVVMVSAPALAA
jgi:hypothetical protein